MWKAMEAGKVKYQFMETLTRNYPYYHMRALGGLVFTAGMLCFVYNVWKTVQKERALERNGAPLEPAAARA
jgi:cytochrome c oxidase cbb3-type subunit 1